MVRLSQAGMGFLKCAFAPPDFNSDPGLGIPDDFMGKTLCRKDVINSSVGFTAAKDTFLVIMPTPGIAYWKVEVPFGTFPLITDTLVAFPYQGFNNMFPASSALIANRSSNVNQFRYASMCVGLYPTSNLTQYGGSITVWKMPLDLSSALVNDTVAGTSRMTYTVNGLAGLQAVSPDNYASSFIEGCYSQSTCSEPNFAFSDILEGIQTLPALGTTATQATMEVLMSAGTDLGAAGILGMGTMDAIVIRVSSPTGAANSAVLKCWACIEYRPTPASAFFQFAKDSPPLDALAMAEYRMIATELPVAVACKDNATFWERVKSIINGAINVGASLPGPVGLVGQGLQGIRSMFSGLQM